MIRLQFILLLSLFAFAPVVAQDAEPDSGAEVETKAEDDEATAADEVTDEEIEDDFDPTEEVRFEQSIPFPTDI